MLVTSEFSEIYSRFYLLVRDYDMVGLTEKIANEMLLGYLKHTLAYPMVRRLFSSIEVDDDMEEIEYELRVPVDDTDKDFIEEVLAVGMVANWASPKYNSTLLTNQFFSNKEQSYYSQANHLAQMKELLTKAQTDLRKLIRDRGYSVAVMNGVTE